LIEIKRVFGGRKMKLVGRVKNGKLFVVTEEGLEIPLQIYNPDLRVEEVIKIISRIIKFVRS
jgi:hypothetical protein